MSPRVSKPGDASTAARRFGLGPKPGDLARIASDPRGYVQSMLVRAGEAQIASTTPLLPTPAVFAEMEELRIEQSIMRTFGGADGATPKAAAGKAGADATMAAQTGGQPAAKANLVGKARRDIFREEALARINRAVATDTPLLERLVYFWSNHFCVSAGKGNVRALAGPFEREAIRPHVLGRFSEMLAAVEHHPAMLLYLDNAMSIGPNSRAGIGRERGLNENLAREILELHTLGVDGGYSQADVTNFARILTGWTFGQGEMVTDADRGRFIFTPNRHEPGTFAVMGKTYAQPGLGAGEAVLADLARHPNTARHLARKLAAHFVSDNPPPALVARLEAAFRDSDGDLGQVTRVLAVSDEAWDQPAAKIVPPFDFTVSLARGFNRNEPGEILRLCGVLGQPLWAVPSPKGWPDADDSWMGPSPIRERLRIAEKLARDVKAGDPRLVLADLAGAGVSEHTRQAVQRAETREQAFELMIMSPDFMRR